MTRALIILAVTLVVMYAGLSLVSSSDEYAAERLLYHAVSVNSKFAVNPEVVPPVMQRSVERDLNIILNRYPKAKVNALARLALAEFYITSKKYDSAVSMLNDIIAKNPDNENMQSRVHFLKGLAYEKQDKWDRALAEYNLLMKKYPRTQIGLQMPFYIARYYYGRGDQPRADDTYAQAVSYYRGLETENRKNIIGYTSANLLVYVYMNLNQYEEAGRAAAEALSNYPLPISLRDQMRNVDVIYINMLKQPQEAIEIFRKVAERTKNPKARKFLQDHIEAIKKQMLDKKPVN